VQLADAQFSSIDDILDLTIRNNEGVPVVLRNVVRTEASVGPSLIERKNQERVLYVTGNVVGRDLGAILAEIQRRLTAIPRPLGYEILLGGDFEEQRLAAIELLFSFATAVLLVYMVMACLYESLTDPLIVMMSVPVAAVGVVVTLILTDTTLNSQSFIGCIMLAGIVVNNAVLIVDQATRLRPEMGSVAAVREAGRRRLRPILMTTLTTVLGLVPLALGVGDGAEAQAPLARAVIGGLLSSTIITLVLIPIIYTLIHRTPPPARAEGVHDGAQDALLGSQPA
jgi:HAE1 family hydrophobic/amphiphilic exporter-1